MTGSMVVMVMVYVLIIKIALYIELCESNDPSDAWFGIIGYTFCGLGGGLGVYGFIELVKKLSQIL